MLLNVDYNTDKRGLGVQMRDIYNTLYRDYEYHPKNTLFFWELVTKLFPEFDEALDVGCGIGYGIAKFRMLNKKIWGCDIANLTEKWKQIHIDQYCRVAPAHHIPFKAGRFDLVLCSDVLEHIPEPLIDDTFKELYRVGNGRYFFHVHSEEEHGENNVTSQGIFNPHILIKPEQWWRDKIEGHGFEILGLNYLFDETHNIFSITALKDTAVGKFVTTDKTINIKNIERNELGRFIGRVA